MVRLAGVFRNIQVAHRVSTGLCFYLSHSYLRIEELKYEEPHCLWSEELTLLLACYCLVSHWIGLFYFLRYITVVYFLNDVEDGGELVLPLANSKFEVFCLTQLSCVCLFVNVWLKKKPK